MVGDWLEYVFTTPMSDDLRIFAGFVTIMLGGTGLWIWSTWRRYPRSKR